MATSAEFFRKYADIVTESTEVTSNSQRSDDEVMNVIYSICEDSETLFRIYKEGWLDQESEDAMFRVAELLSKAARHAENQ